MSLQKKRKDICYSQLVKSIPFNQKEKKKRKAYFFNQKGKKRKEKHTFLTRQEKKEKKSILPLL